jgi:hypothetical protein
MKAPCFVLGKPIYQNIRSHHSLKLMYQIVSNTLFKDFEEGMKWLTLQELNPSTLNLVK